MTDVQILQNIKDVIKHESLWIKDEIAINYRYDSVEPEDDDACAWCLVGAMNYVQFYESISRNQMSKVREHMIGMLSGVKIYQDIEMSFMDLQTFNDDPNVSHSDVMCLLDSSIETLEKSS